MYPSRFIAIVGRLCRAVVTLEGVWLALILPAVILITPTRAPILLVIPLLWLARKLAHGCFVPRTPLDWPLLLLLAMVGVSLFTTFDLSFSLPKIAGVVYGIAVYYAVVAAGRRSARHLAWATAVWLVLGAGIAAFSLVGTQWPAKIPFLDAVIAYLPAGLVSLPGAADGFNPNQVAGVLLWVTPAALALGVASSKWQVASKSKSKSKSKSATCHLPPATCYLLPLLALFFTAVLLLTQSRSAWVGLLAAAGGMTLITLRPHRRLLAMAVPVIGVPLLLVGLAVAGDNSAGSHRLNGTLATEVATTNPNPQPPIPNPQSPTISLAGRLEIWSRAIYAIQDFPLTGMGLGTFRRVIQVAYPLTLIDPAADIAHAHNHLLQTALDLGIPGLVVYLALWWGTAGMLWRSWPAATSRWSRALVVGLAGAWLASFVYGLTDAVALGAKPGFLFWYWLGLVAASHDWVYFSFGASLAVETAATDAKSACADWAPPK